MSTLPQGTPSFVGAEPVWELAMLYPPQGAWSVDEYLDLTDSTNRLIEYTDGRIEVLEMPTIAHQRILLHLLLLFKQFVDSRGLGEVLMAGLRVRLNETKFREPDIVFLKKERREAAAAGDRYWLGSDLVVEIVSPDPKSRGLDLVQKRKDYAAAGINEYWIVDPAQETIMVLELCDGAYTPFGEFQQGQQAKSRLLAGFEIDVAQAFAAANG